MKRSSKIKIAATVSKMLTSDTLRSIHLTSPGQMDRVPHKRLTKWPSISGIKLGQNFGSVYPTPQNLSN